MSFLSRFFRRQKTIDLDALEFIKKAMPLLDDLTDLHWTDDRSEAMYNEVREAQTLLQVGQRLLKDYDTNGHRKNA